MDKLGLAVSVFVLFGARPQLLTPHLSAAFGPWDSHRMPTGRACTSEQARRRIVCRNRRHSAELDETELVMTIGLGRRVDNLRFK